MTTSATAWTVTNPNSDGTFMVAVHTMSLTNTATGDVVSCATPQTSAGTLLSGTYSGDDFAEIGELWADYACSDATGTPVTVHQLPWRFQAESYDPAAGRTSGFIMSHSFTPFVVERPNCDYSVLEWFDPATTFMDFTYTNSSATLTVTAGTAPTALSVSTTSADGCGGLANDGDIVTFSATYSVTPAVTIQGS